MYNDGFGGSVTKTNDRVAESKEQDQTARMSRLILLYTLLKINIIMVANVSITVKLLMIILADCNWLRVQMAFLGVR